MGASLRSRAFCICEQRSVERIPLVPLGRMPTPASPNATATTEYVLGTHNAERDRLVRQHELWLDEASRAWALAGVAPGSRVLDLGCGPGLATESLLTFVGPKGHVAGIEISPVFAAQARERCAAAGRNDVAIRELDLMSGELPVDMNESFDVVWCRWLAMFVREPARIIDAARSALVKGGRVAFHEYVNYGTYSLHPSGPRVAEFVSHAIASFARDGGDAHVARRLPSLLTQRGFEILSLRPIARVGRPGESLWNWPAGFARTYAPRLVALGYVDQAWHDSLLAELAAAEKDPGAFFVAPTVLEIVARAV
jgi:SAM-dependent methyltransferase